jgi:hypothetical protein
VPARSLTAAAAARLSRARPLYALLVAACIASLLAEDELSLGAIRSPT